MAAAVGLAAPGTDPDDQTNITYRDEFFPYPYLDRYTALLYFEQSTFFDRQANNTLARQQGRDPAILGALEFVAPAGGLEYVIDSEQAPHLFVIRKQQRKGPDTSIPGSVTPLAFYYILDKTIYQAPTLHQVLTTRIRRCIFTLHKAFDKLKADLDPLVELTKQFDEQQHARELSGPLQLQAAPPGEGADTDLPPPTGPTQGQGPGACSAEGSALPVDHLPPSTAQPSDVLPMPLPQRLTLEEAEHWKRTDSIIMTVNSGYSLPSLPAVYYQGGVAAQQPDEPAPPPGPSDATEAPAAPLDPGRVSASTAPTDTHPHAHTGQPVSGSTHSLPQPPPSTSTGVSAAAAPTAAGAAPSGGPMSGGANKVKVKIKAGGAAGPGGTVGGGGAAPGGEAQAAKKTKR